MKQKVIKDFLNLPGITGVALMDGRSRPYYYGVNQSLTFLQREALAQGILQVVETTPEGFESFEFQFSEHQVHIYKLDQGMILLVLTSDDIDSTVYLSTIKHLKSVLQEDIAGAITSFRMIATNSPYIETREARSPQRKFSLPQSDEPGPVKPVEDVLPEDSEEFSSSQRVDNRAQPERVESNHRSRETTTQPLRPTALGNRALSGVDPLPSEVQIPATIPPLPPATLREAIAALNHLSAFTRHYLGTAIIVNYWRSTRPSCDWLNNFQISRSAEFSYIGTTLENVPNLSDQEADWIREWVAAFIARCSTVIRDFPGIVRRDGLDDQQTVLLLGPSW